MFNIGDLVEGSMNGEDWFAGTYYEEYDVLAPHGIFVTELNEVRYFVKCRKAAQKNKAETEPSTSSNKQSTKCQCCGSDDDGHNDLYVLCESCADFV